MEILHMLKFLTNSPNSILGMDITSSAVKLLEISDTKGQLCVERYGCEMLAPNLVDGQEIKDSDAVAHSIKKLHQSCHFACKQVALAVSDSAVMTRILSLPKDLNDEEMEAFLKMEANKFIPYPLSEIHLDYAVQNLSANQSTHCDVLTVASRSEPIHNRLKCLHRAGLEVQVIDVESFAVERIGQRLSQELSQDLQAKPIAILEIGIQCLHLFVLEKQQLIFTKEEKLGEHPFKEHHQSLQDHSLQFSKWLLQIKRLLQLFYSSAADDPIEYLFLAGEFANLEGLKARIEAELDIPCQVMNPFANMSIHPRVDQLTLAQDAPSLLVACGLALRQSKFPFKMV